jgi:hypothetical protein
MKIDPTVLGFSGSEVKNWPWRRPRRLDGRRLEGTGSRLARVLGGGVGDRGLSGDEVRQLRELLDQMEEESR